MKIAILADIHANYIALQTVVNHVDSWQPDQVIVAGDVVNRGPQSLACLQLVMARKQSHDWIIIQGNHEDYVLTQVEQDKQYSEAERDFFQHTCWTMQELGTAVDDLQSMLPQATLSTLGGKVHITHASTISNRDGIFPNMEEEELRKKVAPKVAVFCVGHTHRAFVRTLDQTLVVNVGSVGLPFDGDIRPSYAQLIWHKNQWQVDIIRLNYDHVTAMKQYTDPVFVEGSGPMALLIQDELRQARPHLFSWTRQYMADIMAGEINVAASVDRYLADIYAT